MTLHGNTTATSRGTPYAPQNPSDVTNVIAGLSSGTKKAGASKKAGFKCKKSTFPVDGLDGIVVDSWKFNDWDYKRDDLPTYARGLFTYQTRKGKPAIATRGYDKFFNIEEVNDTKWQNIEASTRGPYELSVKENGCIIFISGVDEDHLLVCSKHSTGARQDVDLSHAKAGEEWIDRHLAAIGRTRQDLARELIRRNVTAVAELCDDAFEEHVLAYDEETAGLYLHGMNLNLPEFATYPSALVHEFADEWGLKKAQFLVKDDIETVKTFLEGCAETGSWNGRDTEGFVIRCQKNEHGRWVDWFFKYKFDEPYLMYRQWRESTKAVIAGRVPKYKKHVKITEEYLQYARRQLATNPSLAKEYSKNHGIIKMRDGFLVERGMKGSEIIREEEQNGGDVSNPKNIDHNVLLIPIATIGCGKTTVAYALTKLFGWGHVQNDNITGKTGRPRQFAIQLTNQMSLYPVVIADRNNHQKRERKQIFDDITKVIPEARYIALHYVHDPKDLQLPKIRQVTQSRVFERGDNHQTIQAGSKSRREIMEIMEGFLHRFEPLDPSSEPDENFDLVIDLDPCEDSRHNLTVILHTLHDQYPKLVKEVPSDDMIDDVIAAAFGDYKPDVKHDLSRGSKKDKKNEQRQRADQQHANGKPKELKVEYFALRLPAHQVRSALDLTFAGADSNTARFYRTLERSRRLQPAFHITLIHRASISQHTELWEKLNTLHIDNQQSRQNASDPVLGRCGVSLDQVVWDDRVMCIAAKLLDEQWETANAIAHITIGTASPSIKPKESNDLLQRWAAEGASPRSGIYELPVKGPTELVGEATAVTPATRA